MTFLFQEIAEQTMDRKNVLVPCLKPKDLNLARFHDDNLYRRYLRNRLRPPALLAEIPGPRISDGESFIENYFGINMFIILGLIEFFLFSNSKFEIKDKTLALHNFAFN